MRRATRGGRRWRATGTSTEHAVRALPEVIPTSRTVRATSRPRILKPTFVQAGDDDGQENRDWHGAGGDPRRGGRERLPVRQVPQGARARGGSAQRLAC